MGGVPIFIVKVMAGQSFGSETLKGLYHMKMMVAVCFDDYGEKTTGTYETYRELEYAYNHSIPIIPIRLSSSWPPQPPGEGAMLCDFVFAKDLLYIEGRGTNLVDVAKQIEARWNKG